MVKAARPAKRGAGDSDAAFQAVVDAFAGDREVSREAGKGFGSGTLKVRGKIFAMVSSRGQFVVKLPKARVDTLVAEGLGERFDPGHGRVMKEWLAVTAASASWLDLAMEACRFVKPGK